MRGTPNTTRLVLQRDGIIPAYAGNTRVQDTSVWPRRDHPRVCGEHPHYPSILDICSGSSPRMRGTLRTVSHDGCFGGIIPAYAGNTFSGSVHTVTPEDHPRVCGEHAEKLEATAGTTGSSPRMRGTPVVMTLRSPIAWIIPAYAGNTDCVKPSGMFYTASGSSPRMRGTPTPQPPHRPTLRIIPAYAGNTRGRGL